MRKVAHDLIIASGICLEIFSPHSNCSRRSHERFKISQRNNLPKAFLKNIYIYICLAGCHLCVCDRVMRDKSGFHLVCVVQSWRSAEVIVRESSYVTKPQFKHM